MIIFLLVFLTIYGAINFYAYFKANSVFQFSGKTDIIIITLLILLVLAPIITRLAEKVHWEMMARAVAYCGYLWMAFVFLFFFFNITFDTARYVIKFLSPGSNNIQLRNIFLYLAFFLSIVFVVYGFFDAQNIRVKTLEIHTDKLLPANGKIRIVQISDVHIGLIIRNGRLENILKTVKDAKPDILVSTGDLLDGELDNVMFAANQLALIKPRYGKYAVTGNHEFYAGIEKSMEFIRNAGFEILRNESKSVAGIKLIGLDDPTGRQMGFVSGNTRISDLFPRKPSKDFILILKHQPIIKENNNFDLQLSGHTHGGQIFPFMFLTRLFFPLTCGYHKLNENKSIYISSGAGTWGPPVRFLAPPEITVIDLTNK